jgi:hypothetical protein
MSVEVDIDQVRTFATYALQSWQRGTPDGQRVAGEFSIVWNCQCPDDRVMTHFTISGIGQVENQDPEVRHLFRVPVTLYLKPKQGLHVQILQREYEAIFFQDNRVLIHEFTSSSLG